MRKDEMSTDMNGQLFRANECKYLQFNIETDDEYNPLPFLLRSDRQESSCLLR